MAPRDEPFVIALDGPAAAGKGTLGRRLAAHFGLAYLDTGLLYRAVGVRVLAAGLDPADKEAAVKAARSLALADLDDPRLRGDEAAAAASVVAAIPEVRQALISLQREFAAHPPNGKKGAVLDGRDIGTVICPGADIKIFVTASPEARAERRLRELRERGIASIHSRVLRDMRERDTRDSARAVAPMRAAADAVVLDTTELDADCVFAKALELIEPKLSAPG
jgi:cytidylate kinase